MEINIWIDVVIPLTSAFIGGFLTLAGVWLTIHREKKAKKEATKMSAKPWIYSLDDTENFDYKKANDIIMEGSNKMSSGAGLSIVVKNTDNGICIIDRIETQKKVYYPVIGKVLDKNTIAYIHIYFDNGENLENIRLYVHDVYNNQYIYRIYNRNNIKNNYHIEEVNNKKLSKKQVK